MTTGLQVLLAVLATAVLSMPLYAFTGATRRPDPLASDAQVTFVLGPFVRGWFFWAVSPAVRLSVAVGLGPTFHNLLGVAFGIGAGVAFALGHVTLGGWGVLLGGVADVLDGRVARAGGLADRTGVFLDSTLDRFAEVVFKVRAGNDKRVFEPGVLIDGSENRVLHAVLGPVTREHANGSYMFIFCGHGVS